MSGEISDAAARKAEREAQKRIGEAVSQRATTLDLSDLTLKVIPPTITLLKGLKELRMGKQGKSRANVTSLPSELFQMTTLTTLDLSQNSLNRIPKEIGQLTNLQELILSGNSISDLPSELVHLTKLHNLELADNNFKRWPNVVTELTNLRRLDLSQNQLVKLPNDIYELSNLYYLILRQNRLIELPIEIDQLVNLKVFDLRGNHELQLPPEILNQYTNPKFIINFWHEKAGQNTRPLNEAKLILVGQGGVGKTSLVNKLVYNRHNPEEVTTRGIKIDKWSLPIRRNGRQAEIKLNIWDFGGQEIMHATHQFFLTQRSLYLLVLDARQGEYEGRVEYWLALIQSFAGDSPIIVIINKKDLNFMELNRKGLIEKYPSIRGFVRTSAKTGEGIKQLKELIQKNLARMDHIGTPFPISWHMIKTELESLQAKRNFISYYEYRDLCLKQQISEDNSQRSLVRFLHDLGVLLNFQDDERVRETSILNPEWVTKGVYTLITAESLAKNGGKLESNQLSYLLDRKEYPRDKHKFILDMMEKFELAFPIKGSKQYWIPDLLPADEPELNWPDEDQLLFEYHYSFLPQSVLHRFIVRHHTRILQPYVWLTGVVLAYHGRQALIKADIEARKVTISITGRGTRSEFLEMIRFTFESLHESITGVQPTERVPIPGNPEVTVSYLHLLNLEEMGWEFFVPEGLTKEISVAELLGKIENPKNKVFQGLTSREIYSILNEGLNFSDLRKLTLFLNVDLDNLPGDTKSDKIIELIHLVERRGRLQDLNDVIAKDWPDILGVKERFRPNAYR